MTLNTPARLSGGFRVRPLNAVRAAELRAGVAKYLRIMERYGRVCVAEGGLHPVADASAVPIEWCNTRRLKRRVNPATGDGARAFWERVLH